MATIRLRDSGKWQVIVRSVGLKPISRTFRNHADAKKWANQTEAQIERGDLPSGFDVLRRTSLGSLLEKYRDTVTIGKKGKGKETALINALLRNQFTTLSLSALTPQHFADYRDFRVRTVRPATINRALAILNQVYRLARSEWGIPVQNPLTGLRRPKADRPRERRLQIGEWEDLLAAADKARNKTVRPIIEFALETGMRRSEILAIKWADCNFSNSVLHIPVTKTDTPRTIPLSSNAISILQRQNGNYCPFPTTLYAFDMAWKRLIKRSGLVNFHFHDLRHEAISRFFEFGLNVPEVSLISGHKDYRMLARYTHLRAEAIATKLNSLTR
jgi:integrase